MRYFFLTQVRDLSHSNPVDDVLDLSEWKLSDDDPGKWESATVCESTAISALHGNHR